MQQKIIYCIKPKAISKNLKVTSEHNLYYYCLLDVNKNGVEQGAANNIRSNFRVKKVNVYLPSLMMNVPNHV
jgi:hypothetical protein